MSGERAGQRRGSVPASVNQSLKPAPLWQVMVRLALIAVALSSGGDAAAECRLCPTDAERPAAAEARPLTIDIEAALDLGRAAVRGGGGSIALDERSGARRVTGLTDLGGFAIKGSVRLTGEPFRQVRVSLPSSVRLVAPDGSSAEAIGLRTDLPPAPALDGAGTLVFSFGGQLTVTGDASGEFRGRIPIVADYQ